MRTVGETGGLATLAVVTNKATTGWIGYRQDYGIIRREVGIRVTARVERSTLAGEMSGERNFDVVALAS